MITVHAQRKLSPYDASGESLLLAFSDRRGAEAMTHVKYSGKEMHGDQRAPGGRYSQKAQRVRRWKSDRTHLERNRDIAATAHGVIKVGDKGSSDTDSSRVLVVIPDAACDPGASRSIALRPNSRTNASAASAVSKTSPPLSFQKAVQ